MTQPGAEGSAVRRRHRTRLRFLLQHLHAFILVCFVPVVLGTLGQHGSPLAHLGLAVAIAGLAVLTFVRGERVEHLAASVPLALVTALPAFGGRGDVSAGLMVCAVALDAVRTLPLRHCVSLVAVLIATHAGLHLLTGGVLDAADVSSTYLLAVTNAFMAGAFVASLERSAAAIDAAQDEARSAADRLLQQEARDAATTEVRQVLHDEVLSALLAIQYDHDARGTEPARRLAATAVAGFDALEGAEHVRPEPGHGDLRRLVHEVAHHSPVDLHVALDSDESGGLTTAQLESARRAVLEALRNVRRHSGESAATLTCVVRDGLVVLTVVDEGAGFDDGRAAGFGITESIVGAVESSGGTASVVSSPGRGTTVRLEYGGPVGPAEPQLAQTFRATLRAGADRRLAVLAIVPLTISWTFIALTQIAWRERGLEQGALLVAIAVLMGLVAVRVGSRPPTVRWLTVVAAGLSALQLVGLLLTPDGGMLDLRSWSVGYLATPLIVLCFVLPVRAALALVGLQCAIISGVALLEPRLTGGAVPVTSLNAVLAPSLLTVLLGSFLRRNAAAIRRELEQSAATTAELLRRQALAEAASLHLDHTRRVVVPWLRAVSEHRVDPGTPEARRTAGMLALDARDDLHVPGFYDPALRTLVGRFREAGGSVDVRAGFHSAGQTRAGALLLGQVLEHLPPRHRVSVSPAAPHSARVVVVPPPTEEVLDALRDVVGLEVGGDEHALVVVRSTAPATAAAAPHPA